MSEALVKLQKVGKVLARAGKPRPHLAQEERVALHQMRVEATDAGICLSDTILHNDVPPTVALAVMRRDKYQCHLHDDRCTGPIHVVSKHPVRFVWHHKNNPDHLITVCKAGTDAAQHQR
jgi:hypothetical protein